MKKLQVVLVAGMLACSVSLASAQEPQPQPQGQAQGQGRGMGGGRGIGMLMQGIALTAEQQTRMDALMKKYADERQALMADQSLDQDARRAKMREMMPKQYDKIKAILTDEQKKTFDKNQADMQARMQQGGGQRPPRG